MISKYIYEMFIVFFCVRLCWSDTMSTKELQVQEAPGREAAPGPAGIAGTMGGLVKLASNELLLHSSECAPPNR